MTDAKYKLGDQVRYLDDCLAREGTVVSVDDGFVEVETATSSISIRKTLLERNVFHRDDIKGFSVYLREQAVWLQRQASKLEGKGQH